MRRSQRTIKRRNARRGLRIALGESLEPRIVLSLTPQLLADANPAPAGIFVHGPIVELNGLGYFSGGFGAGDFELWKSDGTTAGTVLVKDINPGSSGSNPDNLININGTLWFSASDGTNGEELWKSDGTAAGTVMVKDIDAGFQDSSPSRFTNVNGTIFFTAFDFDAGTELWRTDGTTSGTTRVKDIVPGFFGPSIDQLTNFNGKLFFRAAEDFADWQLWTSDGTDVGTVKVTNVTGAIFGLYPDHLTVVGSTLFFSGATTTDGTELWKSDGKAAGTSEVLDISTGGFPSFPNLLTNLNGTLLFTPPFGDGELWRSDGTAAGTVQLKDIYPGGFPSSPKSLVNLGGTLFFTATDPTDGLEPWISDGTAAGTQLLKDVQPGSAGSSPNSFVKVGTSVYFGANIANGTGELWKTDGTTAGTALVKGLIPAVSSGPNSGIQYLANVGGRLIFAANDGVNGFELWTTDGTAGGTTKVVRDATSTDASGIANVTTVGSTAFFTAFDPAHGRELWKTDGTPAGTLLLDDILPGPQTSSVGALVNLNGTLLFAANDGTTGSELWTSNGTPAGTTIFRDIFTGAGGSSPKYLTNVNGTVYFSASDGTNGSELWKTDGTVGGTSLVKDIRSGASSSYPKLLTNVNGRLFFIANDGTSGNELWTSDGTAAGTIRLRDIRSGSYSSNPSLFTAVGSTLFFIANDGNNGNELWKSNGTAAGTSLVKTIASSSTTPAPTWLTNVNGTLYFTANDGTTGVELWKSDGSTAGTARLKDIRSGSSGSSPNWLTNVNGTLFFSATDSASGNELWKSDGTAAGTVIAKDIVTGVVSGQPGELANIRGTLVFAATTTASGREIWASDGTAAGTVQIVDVVPGAASSSPQGMITLGHTLLFTADDGVYARELWGASEPNVAPSGTNKTATALEDTPYTLGVGDFGFTDAGNTIPDSLLSVQITAVPAIGSAAIGTLQDNGTDVAVNQIIPVADITSGKLVYTPPPNKNGNALTAITFKVQDDGGTANGGSDTALTSDTLTFNVTSVNDPPVSADFTITASDHLSYTISFNQIPFSDPNDTPPIGSGPPNASLGVKIITLPSTGSLTDNGSAVTAGQVVLRGETFVYTPAATDFTSQTPYTSFTFQVQDVGGTANGGLDLDQTPRTLTINLVGNNTPPVSADNAVTAYEDTDYVFQTADFAFSDAGDSPANLLAAVQIVSLPTKGTLYSGASAVTSGAVVSRSVIENGGLRFRGAPNANAILTAYDSFTFKVQDDGGTSNGGSDTDLVARTMTVNVTPVNDPAVGASNIINPLLDNHLLEDHDYTFTTSDFPFSDASDIPTPNTMSGVVIASLPTSGQLRLNNTDIQVGQLEQLVTVAQLNSGSLVFRPAANANNTNLNSPAAFTFEVKDNGGTLNGGADTDPFPKTMTLNITPVNDTPVIFQDKTFNIAEDQSYTFITADFSFTDPSDLPSDAFSNAIVTAPSAAVGTLRLNGTAITPGTNAFATVASINASQLVFTPAANINSGNAANPTLSFKVQDTGGVTYGGQDVSVTPRTFTFNIAAVNDPPSGQDKTINFSPNSGSANLLEDGFYVFTISDFGFNDVADFPALNNFQSVEITTLPNAGTLYDDLSPLSAGQFISAAAISNGRLNFVPAANGNGAPYASFTFQVKDDGGTVTVLGATGIDLDPISNTMTLNVTSVNDPPATQDNTVTTLEDTPYTFSTADFPFSDPNDNPPNVLNLVKITSLPAAGTLREFGFPVVPPEFISPLDLAAGQLTFTPAANGNGLNYASFLFQVQDNGSTAFGGADTTPYQAAMRINVTPVSDPPLGVSKTINPSLDDTLYEDSYYRLTDTDFGFSDANDNPRDSFTGVIITTLPAAGVLKLNDTEVAAGDFIAVSFLQVGDLYFYPDANGNGAAYASFTFQVQDNGLTVGGGLNRDPVPKTMTLNVTPVNDAPQGTSQTAVALEDTTYTVTAADFGFTDANDSPPNHFQAVIFAFSNHDGQLLLAGQPVITGDPVSIADVNAGRMTYKAPANANGPVFDSYTFKVQDDGNPVFPSRDTDSSYKFLTFDVTPVNDPPTCTINKPVPSVTDESGPQKIDGFLTCSPGPVDESAQTISIATSAGTSNLFTASGQPAIDAAGALTFTPAPNAHGTATVGVTVKDTGGTADGGSDTAGPLTFTITITKPHIWHNAAKPLDADDDGTTAPGDALAIINYVNAFGSFNDGKVPAVGTMLPNDQPVDYAEPFGYLDVSGDDFVVPADALLVINQINAFGSGEGEASFTAAALSSAGVEIDSDITVMGGAGYFFGRLQHTDPLQLWRTDGTGSGTVQLTTQLGGTDGGSISNGFYTPAVVNGTLFFSANDGVNGYELWKSDGTSAGTMLVADKAVGGPAYPSSLVNVNGTLFFQAVDSAHGSELWRSNGTAAGTQMIKDINPGPIQSFPIGLTNVNSKLLFTADDDVHGRELWTSDGTDAGTVLVKDINPGSDRSSFSYFTSVSGTLFFPANDGVHGYELWKSDGTAAGTVLAKDIITGSADSFPLNRFANVNGTLYFDGADFNYQLWKTDVAAGSTMLVKDISSFGDGTIQAMTNANGTLFFTTGFFSAGGVWTSDGTSAGTVLLAPISLAAGNTYLTNVGGNVFFRADDGIHGQELWKSDGTAAGTAMLKDLLPGASDSSPYRFANVNGKLLFGALDSGGIYRLWSSDGTASGTSLIAGAPANHAPSFTKGPDQNVFDESGPQNVAAWATAISAGPADESAQHVQFVIQNNTNSSLFAVPPSIDSSGKLAYTPAPNREGAAQITIVLRDDGGTALGGQDTSTAQTFMINVAKPHPWYNTANGFDVSGDGHVVAADALAVINYVNAFGAKDVPAGAATGSPYGYLDVDGDNSVVPGDALLVIDQVNAFGVSEGEPPQSSDDLLLALLAYDVATAQKPRRM